MTSHTEESIFEDIQELNARFIARSFEPKALRNALELLGYNLDRCVVFEVFPDSGSTWIVRLMSQDGILQELDIDLEESGENRIERLDLSIFRKGVGRLQYEAIQRL